MSKLSIEKLNNYKKMKCLTNKKISKETNIPIATIDRLFSGASKNPSITILQKVAGALECTVDDFIEYENCKEINLHNEKEAFKIALQIQSNPAFKTLFSSLANLEKSDVDAICHIVKRMEN